MDRARLARIRGCVGDQQFLARDTIPVWWEIVDAAVARIEAFHDAVAQGSAALTTRPHMERVFERSR